MNSIKKLNILFISGLFPASKKDNETVNTFALYYLFKNMDVNNKLVIRPYLLPKISYSGNKNVSNKFIIFNGIKIINYPIVKIPWTLFYFVFILKKIKKDLLNFNPDLIIAHNGGAFFLAYKISKMLNKPLICGIHIPDIKRINRLGNKNLIRIFNYSKSLSCRSYSIYNELIKRYKEYKAKTFVAYSGIEKNLIESKLFFNNKIDNIFINKEFKIITVSRLLKYKKIDLNLRVLSKLPKYIKWSYQIVGDGPEYKNLQKKINQLKLNDKVKLIGNAPREKVFSLLKSSHIFLLVSTPETFGLVYLEAMAKGNVVIATKDQGVDGIIKNNVNGFLCESNTEDKLFDILMNIFTKYKKNDISNIINNSYKTILEYTMEKASENYLQNILKAI